MNHSPVSVIEDPEILKFAASVIAPVREPVLILDSKANVLAANAAFTSGFGLIMEEIQGQPVLKFRDGLWHLPQLEKFLEQLLSTEASAGDQYLSLKNAAFEELPVSINAGKFAIPGKKANCFLLSFEIGKEKGNEITYRKLLNEILSEAPAYICIVRGPDHVFELANEKYLSLMGYRDIIGKKAKDALPEVENQGFFEMLDGVYETGEAFVGEEVALTLKNENEPDQEIMLNFMYQPMRDASGKVNGIFVHAVDVTETVQNRKKLEESEKDLRNLIDTVPVIVWITNQHGEGYYLNKNWYSFTGQELDESLGAGWLRAVHPDDYKETLRRFEQAHREQSQFNVSYRLKSKSGDYRWVIDRGRPKYDGNGNFQGFIGAVIDVHEDKMKEQVIIEKEHRTRSIVEEATVATAVYLGKEMKIEFANDAMIQVWGKTRAVVGQTLREALPELEGQPFYDLLQHVFETGETYWGEEDRVDLVKNGKLETGFFNFTYKPLRDPAGKIYGILNMAIDVSDMVHSRNLIKEREEHFTLLANLMPEKVINTDVNGEAVYFNRNWLEYTGLSSSELKELNWNNLIHEEDREQFELSWQRSLATGSSFEMELRLKDREGKYLWHLSRAEAVRGEDNEVSMWIGTNTEIQKIKEEEKRKGDFLKMVSHELKTPITSIKGYIQLLLNILGKSENADLPVFPLKPSLERIDIQIGRLTRLISEILDLSRLEDSMLKLKSDVFSINELVEQTVQDIRLTNTQHQIEVFHKDSGKVRGDKDRIGQVLINFVTNAIKYSPDNHYVEIHIYKPNAQEIAVSVKDKGIGISAWDQKHIFKRFYRIGSDDEDTYSGFGIGLYLASEIIQRHNGKILVDSRKGQGSDFTFVLAAVSE